MSNMPKAERREIMGMTHTRQAYHERIAKTLAADFSDTIEPQPALVAHHYTEAGLLAEAVPYWQRAGVQAAARSACVEAVAHLHKGLELLQTLADSPSHVQQELDILTVLGPTLMALKSPVDSKVEQVYARARELCQQVGTTPKLVWALEGLWAFYLVRGKLSISLELGLQLLSLAEELQNPLAFAVAHQTLGLTLFYLGEFVRAAHHLEEGAAHYALQSQRSRTVRGLHDPGVMCHAFAALTACMFGDLEQALIRMHTMLQLAQEVIHPYSLAFAHCAAAVTHQYRKEIQETQKQAELAINLATEHGFPLWAAMGTILRGWALALQGQTASGIEDMRTGLISWRATGAENILPYFLALLAEASGKADQITEGLRILEEARIIVGTTEERWWEAEILRLQGELLLMQSSPEVEEAENCFRQALHTARQQGAKLWELRVVASWSHLLGKQGKREEAQSLRKTYSVPHYHDTMSHEDLD